MPYYVYQISPTIAKLVKPLEKLAEFESYKEARNYARDKRQVGGGSDNTFKVIFAETPLDAEEKLAEVREQPILKEWEK